MNLAERVKQLLADSPSPAFTEMVVRAGRVALDDPGAGDGLLMTLERALEDKRARVQAELDAYEEEEWRLARLEADDLERRTELRVRISRLPQPASDQMSEKYDAAADLEEFDRFVLTPTEVAHKNLIEGIQAKSAPLVFFGVWVAGMTYETGSVVVFRNLLYVALQQTSVIPLSPYDWRLLSGSAGGSGRGAPGTPGLDSTVPGPKGDKGDPGSGAGYAESLTTDGMVADFTITHGLGTTDIVVQVWASDVGYASTTLVDTEVDITDVNTIQLHFAEAPGSGQPYRVIVMAVG